MVNVTKNTLGIPISSLFLLALLGVPRVIVHDLKWVEPGSIVNMLLAMIPPIIWIVVVLWKKAIKPFKALLLVGIIYGILLGITHQIFWHITFDELPTLGGNLAAIPPFVNAFITRAFGFFSSLFTGTIMGIILGLIGLWINRIRT
ncbi:hypothetical protein JOC86_003834 [Bacillus pakistanensis]|uniref:DUF819 family protein n=1 Tax=Rossellomorea pakistanensis TaxID=992288 RepID=A0ABS2NI89_9BACI|nr:hypothetical protein [Bacillus pakistanensis]MBM7587261.1 hypothetical protein [Bacillus pakistanensis]